MFSPNLTGNIARRTGRDIHARPVFGPVTEVAFSLVSLMVGAQKTTVRADSSASRGGAEEIAAQTTKILLPPEVEPRIDDRFFYRMDFRIIAVQPRITVGGDLDHWECDLEVLANGS